VLVDEEETTMKLVQVQRSRRNATG